MVVDERYNGGGSAADYIVDVLGATSMATLIMSPAIVIHLPVRRRESGDQR